MNQNSPTKPSPFCLRLSPEERSRLERDAAGLALGEYVRQRIFDESLPKRRVRGKFPVKDHQALSQVLGQLGRSRLSQNLNQLALAANQGVLVLSPEVMAVLLESCADVREMRVLLMRALGLADQS